MKLIKGKTYLVNNQKMTYLGLFNCSFECEICHKTREKVHEFTECPYQHEYIHFGTECIKKLEILEIK